MTVTMDSRVRMVIDTQYIWCEKNRNNWSSQIIYLIPECSFNSDMFVIGQCCRFNKDVLSLGGETVKCDHQLKIELIHTI